MNLKERISALVALGKLLKSGEDEFLNATIKRTAIHNPWFTEDNQKQAIDAIATYMLEAGRLQAWINNYEIKERPEAQWIGLVLAGNLPLVGFHDLLCVFVSGHRARIKLSEKDPYLLPALLRALKQIDERTASYFEVVTRLADFSAVIATGSNNSARYFESYFSKYPHIIRRNRNGVAVLSGEESSNDLLSLGVDVFSYFGMGCRNVAKLYVPEGYHFDPLLEALHQFKHLVNHTKYKNNFDYNYALYLLNKVDFKANGCILMREEPSLHSSIATLHYEYYSNTVLLAEALQNRRDEIQLVVSKIAFEGLPVFAFGEAQQPTLTDYADGVDTMQFLLNL
jgi:hypothetical protein